MRQTERVPLDALAEIAELKKELRDLKAVSLKRIHEIGVIQTWTPAYVDITKGNGTELARYVRINGLVIARFKLVFGSSTTIDGTNPTVSAPVTSNASYEVNRTPVGQVMLRDDGTANYVGTCTLTGSVVEMRAQLISATHLQQGPISATLPHTWAVNDVIAWTIAYEPA